MPTFTPFVAPAFGFGGDNLFAIFEDLLDTSFVINTFDANGFSATLNGTRFEVTGTGLEFDDSDGTTLITGGTLNSISTFNFSGVPQAEITGLTLDVTDIASAVLAELNGDVGAYERLIFDDDWLILASSVEALHSGGTFSDDGVRLNFTGNDTIELGDDRDIFNAGDGNDRVFGRDGNDVLEGDDGRDRLQGGRDNDVLNGGENRDFLSGGKGNDFLSGGGAIDRLRGDGGRDFLDGGRGRDVLTGGGGADSFLFRRGDADDRITDFEVGEDALFFANFASLDLIQAAIGDSGFVEIDYDGGSVLLENVTDVAGVQDSISLVFDS